MAMQFLEDDERSKVSRWQIGTGSLSVLEQVYHMDPFPGARRAALGKAPNCVSRALFRAAPAPCSARDSPRRASHIALGAASSPLSPPFRLLRVCRPRHAARAGAEAQRVAAAGAGVVPEQAAARAEDFAREGHAEHARAAGHAGDPGGRPCSGAAPIIQPQRGPLMSSVALVPATAMAVALRQTFVSEVMTSVP